MILIKNEIEWTKKQHTHTHPKIKPPGICQINTQLVYNLMGIRAPGDKGF